MIRLARLPSRRRAAGCRERWNSATFRQSGAPVVCTERISLSGRDNERNQRGSNESISGVQRMSRTRSPKSGLSRRQFHGSCKLRRPVKVKTLAPAGTSLSIMRAVPQCSRNEERLFGSIRSVCERVFSESGRQRWRAVSVTTPAREDRVRNHQRAVTARDPATDTPMLRATKRAAQTKARSDVGHVGIPKHAAPAVFCRQATARCVGRAARETPGRSLEHATRTT
jgi:hypothetical protein